MISASSFGLVLSGPLRGEWIEYAQRPTGDRLYDHTPKRFLKVLCTSDSIYRLALELQGYEVFLTDDLPDDTYTKFGPSYRCIVVSNTPWTITSSTCPFAYKLPCFVDLSFGVTLTDNQVRTVFYNLFDAVFSDNTKKMEALSELMSHQSLGQNPAIRQYLQPRAWKIWTISEAARDYENEHAILYRK